MAPFDGLGLNQALGDADSGSAAMTFEEFLARYRISRRSGQRIVARGELPVMRIGRLVRVLESDARAWAAARRTSA